MIVSGRTITLHTHQDHESLSGLLFTAQHRRYSTLNKNLRLSKVWYRRPYRRRTSPEAFELSVQSLYKFFESGKVPVMSCGLLGLLP